MVGTLSADALWAYAVSGKLAGQADADPVAFVRKPAPPPPKPKRRTARPAPVPDPPPVIDSEPAPPARDEKGMANIHTLGDTPSCEPPVPSPREISRTPAAVPDSEDKPKADGGRPKQRRRYVSQKARRLLLEQLAHGPRPGAHIEAAVEAAGLTERALFSAADELGVRTQRGQWWLPG